MDLNTLLPSLHPHLFAFSLRTIQTHILSPPFSLSVGPSPSIHPSFFHLNLSQGDLGWAHLLSSLFSLSPPPLPPQISEGSFPCLNPPIPRIRLYPSLQLLVSPPHLSFFTFTLGCRLPYFLSIFLIIATHVFFSHISSHLSICPPCFLTVIWLAPFSPFQYHKQLNAFFIISEETTFNPCISAN